MRVLGIDPGLSRMGYGVVERNEGRLKAIALGVIKTDPGLPQAIRLAQLRHDVVDVIASYSPDVFAIERLFFNANVRTAISVGQASGIALASAAEAGLEVFDYTPPEVKQSVAGNGAATKKQVQAMITALLKLAEIPQYPDAADACALAICHLNRSGLRRAVGVAR